MFEFFLRLFSDDYMPHGHCYYWEPGVVWLHVLSDGLIALSYFSIPLALAYFTRRRTDLRYRWIFSLFAGFILACGTTHALSIWVLWDPIYRVEGVVKAVTAVVSFSTAVLLWRLIPDALSLPSPSDLESANERLRLEVEERKRAEEDVKRLNADLEARVEERTEALRRTNEDLERFAYVASHDLREPLRMVSSYSEVLKEHLGDDLDEDARVFLHFIGDGSLRMQALIDDLLAYSRATRKETTEVDLGEVLKTVRSNLRISLEEAGGSLEAGDLPRVLGERTALVQVFQNLVSNSIKYSGDSPPRIEIRAARAEDEPNMHEIVVTDNGIGFDPEYGERIFEMFQRLHTREEYPGTGMGLAIVKKIVEQYGGRIRAESEPGQGTTVRFTLPAAR